MRRPKIVFVLIAGLSAGVAMASPALSEELVGGPAIPGVCVLNREAVFTASLVGKDVTRQYQASRDAAQAAVKAEEAKLAGDAKTLEGMKETLSEDQYQTRLRDLVARQQGLRLEASQKSQDLEAMRISVVKRIAEAAQPFVASSYGKYRCSLLLSRDAVLAGNPGMDVTTDVISGLDGKITTMKFERDQVEEHSL